MELYMYSSKKTELYMYNPKKMGYTFITRKKWSYTFLYISSFLQVLGQRFLKVHSLFGVCLTKKMRPHGPRLLKSKSSHMLSSGIQILAGAAQWAAVIQIEGDAHPTKPHFFLGTPSRLKSVHRSHCC